MRTCGMLTKKVFMFLVLQSALFCLAINCTKPPIENISNYPGTPGNNDSTMTDTTSNTDSTTNVDTASNTREHSWLALGYSYTIGQSVGQQERFPAQTISLLKKDSLSFSYEKNI